MLFVSKKQLVSTNAKLGPGVYLQAFSKQVANWSVEVGWRSHRSCSTIVKTKNREDDCRICYVCAVLG